MSKPFTHIGYFSRNLVRFATYLSSQRIKYRLYSDYDGEFIIPINSKFIFTDRDGLIRIDKINHTTKKFDLMPTREEIIN